MPVLDRAVEHLYRGEQFDPNLGWYYLRARYMDPGRGQFASMDSARGFAQAPQTNHYFAYAHLNPIGNVDPSGHFMISEKAVADQIVAILKVAAAALILNEDRLAAPIMYEARSTVRVAAGLRTRLRDPRLPIIYFGRDVQGVTDHIADAQSGGLEAVLSKSSTNIEPDRSWYRNHNPCKGKTFDGSGFECDEYPFASTDQGGRFNALGLFGWRVSLAVVSEQHNRDAGLHLKRFYRQCNISTMAPNRGWFGVVAFSEDESDFDCGR